MFASRAFFKYDILKCSEAWKRLPWLRLIFSDMICMYTHIIARVMCIYPLHCCDGGVCLHHDLPIMHAPWLSHCKSSWSCVNWKLASKHLDVTHGVIPHAAKISALTRWSRGTSLRDARYVNKLFNLLSLTECGFYGHLEEDGLFYLNMDVYCRPRRSSPLIFKIVPAPKWNRQKTRT